MKKDLAKEGLCKELELTHAAWKVLPSQSSRDNVRQWKPALGLF